MAFALTRLSSKGQVVIPEQLRARIGLAEGDAFAIFEHQGLLVLQRLTHSLTEHEKEQLTALTQVLHRQPLTPSDSVPTHKVIPSYIH